MSETEILFAFAVLTILCLRLLQVFSANNMRIEEECNQTQSL